MYDEFLRSCMQARFSHLTIYGASYYSYLYARCLSEAIWQTHLAADSLDATSGELYTHSGCQSGLYAEQLRFRNLAYCYVQDLSLQSLLCRQSSYFEVRRLHELTKQPQHNVVRNSIERMRQPFFMATCISYRYQYSFQRLVNCDRLRLWYPFNVFYWQDTTFASCCWSLGAQWSRWIC
jgi:hypothetical protein